VSTRNEVGELRLSGLDRRAEMRRVQDRHATLSQREREVMALVVAGLLNKQIAGKLGISVITVKAHRGKVMRKMRVGSVADLVKMGALLANGNAGGMRAAAPAD
jgi:FixJ family two-component response regulator